jgi:hypothetical protein
VLDTSNDSASKAGGDVKACLHDYYYNYDDYDMIAFPILYGTDIGEAATVDVIRISPEDATRLIDERIRPSELRCHKLAGTALGHFGGFMERRWRRNDILWGRLDGAERLIRTLLPHNPKADALIGEAQAEIVLETLGHLESPNDQRDLLVECAMRPGCPRNGEKILERFLTKLMDVDDTKGNDLLRTRLEEAIGGPQKLQQHYQATFKKHHSIERRPALRSAARAATVVRKMLSDLSRDHDRGSELGALLTTLGKVFWTPVEIAARLSSAVASVIPHRRIGTR